MLDVQALLYGEAASGGLNIQLHEATSTKMLHEAARVRRCMWQQSATRTPGRTWQPASRKWQEEAFPQSMYKVRQSSPSGTACGVVALELWG